MAEAEIDKAKLLQVLLQMESDVEFQKIARAQDRVNLFRIVGNESRERWHSAFWAWILDPHGSHGVGSLALRHLLARAATREGTIPAVLLEPNPNRKQGTWHPSAAHRNLELAEILALEVDQCIVAPGPASNYSEITSRRVTEALTEDTSSARKGRRKGRRSEDARFDVLIGLRGRVRMDKGTKPLALVVVVEMKVGAAYDPDQLRRYSRWVYERLSIEDLHDAGGEFCQSLGEILANAEQSGEDLFGVGVFLGPDRIEGDEAPHRLAPPWGAVRIGDLAHDVLVPAVQHPEVDDHGRPLLQAYLDLLADPDTEISMRPTEEQRQLVLTWFKRHKKSISVVVNVLKEAEAQDELAGDFAEHASNAVDAQSDVGRQKKASDKPSALKWGQDPWSKEAMNWKQVYIEGTVRLLALGMTKEDLDECGWWTALSPEDPVVVKRAPVEIDGGLFIGTKLSAESIRTRLARGARKLRRSNSELDDDWVLLTVQTASDAEYQFPEEEE
jgi:hypothetical protein